MKIMTIDFTRRNPWGTSDHCTHYYVDGKRVKASRICQSEMYALEHCRYDRTEHKFVTKDGIDRYYTTTYFTERD